MLQSSMSSFLLQLKALISVKTASNQHIATIYSALFTNLWEDEAVILEAFLLSCSTSPEASQANQLDVNIQRYQEVHAAPELILPMYAVCLVDHILLKNITKYHWHPLQWNHLWCQYQCQLFLLIVSWWCNQDISIVNEEESILHSH